MGYMRILLGDWAIPYSTQVQEDYRHSYTTLSIEIPKKIQCSSQALCRLVVWVGPWDIKYFP